MDHQTWLLIDTALAIAALIGLIAWFKVNSFVALTLVALAVGLGAGLPPVSVAEAFQHGVGDTLEKIALVIGFGAILGQMLAESGGAGQIASALIGVCGVRRLPLTLAAGAFLIGLPMFFQVGLVLLIPIAENLAERTGKRLYRLGLPLVAGLSVSHGLVPPHPGPLAAIGILHADVGLTLVYSLLIGLPTTVICGLTFARVRVKSLDSLPVHWGAGSLAPSSLGDRSEIFSDKSVESEIKPACPLRPASAGLAVAVILLPVVLMIGATVAKLGLEADSPARTWIMFLGHPVVALSIAVVFAFLTLGAGRGVKAAEILETCRRSLLPIGDILLLLAAGGGLSSVLIAAGAGEAIAARAEALPLSPLVLAWLLAAAVRVATGSATVAVSTAAGLVAPLTAGTPHLRPELVVLALGAGSLVLSHVNDGGFWLVQKYLRLTVPQTLRTWTILESMISLVALALILLLAWAMIRAT